MAVFLSAAYERMAITARLHFLFSSMECFTTARALRSIWTNCGCRSIIHLANFLASKLAVLRRRSKHTANGLSESRPMTPMEVPQSKYACTVGVRTCRGQYVCTSTYVHMLHTVALMPRPRNCNFKIATFRQNGPGLAGLEIQHLICRYV